jgi:hypothetical protein
MLSGVGICDYLIGDIDHSIIEDLQALSDLPAIAWGVAQKCVGVPEGVHFTEF